MPDADTAEKRLYGLLQQLSNTRDEWDYLNQEERHGVLDHACHEIATVLDGNLEWEVGVREQHDPDTWEHYHPTDGREQEARRSALEQAREDGFEDPVVYDVSGPLFEASSPGFDDLFV